MQPAYHSRRGVFTGAGVKTVVLFFTKGEPTQKIWYYQLDKHFTKTQPLTEDDLADFLTLQKTKADSENSWSIDVSSLGEDYDLSVKNPNKVEEKDERTPAEIFDSILNLQSEANGIVEAIQEEFWKDDIEDVFGFADENSDDFIIHHRLTEEEKQEYNNLQKQANELKGKMAGASEEEQDRFKKGFREKYAKMEDIINKYKNDVVDYEEDEA